MKKNYTRHKHPGIRPGRKPKSFIIDFIDHNGKRRQKSFYGTESEAVKARHQILAKVTRIKAGIELPPEKMNDKLTLKKLWKLFKKDRERKIAIGDMSQKSLDRCKNSYNALNDFKPVLNDQYIDNIEPKVFEQFKAYRLSKNKAKEGVNADIRNIKTLFNFAVTKGFLDRTPMSDVSRLNTERIDVRFLNESELQKLHKALQSLNMDNEYEKDAHDLVIFYLFTGARLSEILFPHFTWKCVGNNSIHFPKTKYSKNRTIPMVEAVRNILNSRKNVKYGPFFSESAHIVKKYGDLEKCYLTKNMAYLRVKFVFDKAEIKSASTHTLRKTAGAWYYTATRDIFATSRFLGHTSVLVTEQHYAGLIQSLQTEYSEKFEVTLISQLNSKEKE